MKRLLWIAAALIACSSLAVADSPPLDRAERERVLQVARGIIDQAGFATLITVDDDGQPQARVMDPTAPDGAFVVWMATKSTSRKVSQIRRNSRVTLHYFDTSTLSYVTLLGTASIVADPAEKDDAGKRNGRRFIPAERRTRICS